MKKTKMKIILPLILFCGFVSLHAYEEPRAIVSERPMTYAEKARWFEDLALEEEANQATLSYHKDEKKLKCGFCHIEYPELVTQNVYEMGYNGSTVMLSDWSVWLVKPGEGEKIQDWPTETNRQSYEYPTRVFLTQNTDFLRKIRSKGFEYKLVHAETGQKVHITLSMGPYLTHCYAIISMNKHKGTVTLHDGTVWNMSSFDSSIYKNWNINDSIILGVNSRWNHYWSPYLLINVTTGNHVRADIY